MIVSPHLHKLMLWGSTSLVQQSTCWSLCQWMWKRNWLRWSGMAQPKVLALTGWMPSFVFLHVFLFFDLFINFPNEFSHVGPTRCTNSSPTKLSLQNFSICPIPRQAAPCCRGRMFSQTRHSPWLYLWSGWKWISKGCLWKVGKLGVLRMWILGSVVLWGFW